jgi:molecular chaperone DnaK (HSP70)
VIDFGGGTFDVCVITTTKEGDISQGGRMARPLSASSNSIGGFSVNRLIAEELIRKVLASRNVTAKVNKGLELYRRWRKEGMDLTSLSTECYCTFAYSALACFRMGMSGLGSF